MFHLVALKHHKVTNMFASLTYTKLPNNLSLSIPYYSLIHYFVKRDLLSNFTDAKAPIKKQTVLKGNFR